MQEKEGLQLIHKKSNEVASNLESLGEE